MNRFAVPLADLVRAAQVPREDQVELQDEVVGPPGEVFSADAEAMGMPRLPGAGL